MRVTIRMLALLAILALTSTAGFASQATPASPPAKAVPAAQPERWLHVRVDNQTAKGEMVRINLPLELAEKVLPTIKNDKLRDGKIRLNDVTVNGVDLRGMLAAVRTSKDGEYVTIQGQDGEVRVFKKAGYIEAHINKKRDGERTRVEVRVPLSVVDALLSAGENELNLVAAVRALSKYGDTELVTVKDENSTVRVWLDSKNTTE